MTPKIIEARDLKVGDRFLTSLGYIDSIVEIRQRDDILDSEDGHLEPVVDVWFGEEKCPLLDQYRPDELVARIDPDEPEPVEVRRYERDSPEVLRLAVACLADKLISNNPRTGKPSREELVELTAELAIESSLETLNQMAGETVLSRETVLPEGEKS